MLLFIPAAWYRPRRARHADDPLPFEPMLYATAFWMLGTVGALAVCAAGFALFAALVLDLVPPASSGWGMAAVFVAGVAMVRGAWACWMKLR